MLLLLATAATARPLRVATYSAALSRDGPGLLLRDILRGDPQIDAVTSVITAVAPDILLLTDIDWDHDGVVLSALGDALRAAGGPEYRYRLSLKPNSGVASHHDLDGNGRDGEPRDALGYGRFPGDGGMALLSRYPIVAARDFTSLLWRNLPGATLPSRDGGPFPSADAQAIWPLSSTGHWAVPIQIGGDQRLTLLAFAATPPVFDGPEDANGLRNRDELRLWTLLLDRRLGEPPAAPFIIAGNANLDPQDGDGIRQAMADVLADPRLVDPQPGSAGGGAASDPEHHGNPALDTADWRAPPGGPGNLRVDYLLPSREGVSVVAAGVWWPTDGPEAEVAALASAHRLVWLDLEFE